MGAIAAPQNNPNYQSNSQSTDFQVGPKAVSSDDQTLTLKNDMFGLHGPFSLQAVYSKLFGMTVEGTYTQVLGLKDAALIELDLGGKQRRIAGTWGHALTSTQLFKLTAENLSQNLDFDFVTGKIRKWMYQNAIGGSYAYLIKNGLFNDINLNAYYSKANSKNLPSIDYTSGTGVFRDFRRIAGGVDKSASVGVHLLPTPATLIGIAADYDNVSYKMRNDLSTKRDENGLGATVSLDQLINDHIKFNLLASHRKPYQDYKAEVDWLVNSAPGSSLELGVLGERVIGNLGTRNDTQGGVNFAYTWGGNPTAKPMLYGVPKADTGISGLRDWVSNPAVRMEQVLALKDERIQRIGTVTTHTQPKLAANNGNAIEIHPGETKQIDVTQYFASHSDNKNASKIVYTVKALPKGHDLKYQDGKLIINQDSFTKKDVDQKFVINFEPANTNSITSLSMVSLVLAVKNGPMTPYPNPKYYNSGKGITKDLHADVAYDHESPIAEEQTIDNQLMINPDPDYPGNDLKIYFKSDEVKKLNDLGLTLNVDPKPRPKINHYFIITFSGTPKSNVGPHTFHLYVSNKYGGETTTPLPITLNILSSGPAISWKDQTPNYNVGDKPNEEIADASASPDHKLTDVSITPDGGKAHDLAYYGITANIDKSDPTWKINLVSTTGVILPDPADTQQQYKLTVTDDNTNKTIAEDFTLTVKNGNPTITWKNQKPNYKVGEKPTEEIALGNASTDYNVSDVTIAPDGDESHELSDYHLTADITGKGTPQATITLKSTDGVVLPDPKAQTQHYKLTVTDSNTNKSVSEDFTLTVNSDTPYINWINQTPSYKVGDKPNEEIADACASSGHNVTDVTIAADGDKQHELDYYGITPVIDGKGTPTAKISLTSTGIKLPDPTDTTQHYKLTVTDDNTNKTIAEDFTLTVKNGSPTITWENQKPAYNIGEKPTEEIALGNASTDYNVSDVTIVPDGDESHELSDYHLTADITGKGTPQATVTLTSTDGIVLPDPKAQTQHYKLTVTDSNTNKSVSEDFTLTVNSDTPYINWVDQTPNYKVGDKPNEEIADACASGGHNITNVTIAPDGGKAHPLSYYGLNQVVTGIGTETATIKLASTDGVILPDPEENTQKYKLTAVDDKTNKTVSEDFTLTVKNGNPAITWKDQKPTYKLDSTVKEEIAVGYAGKDHKIKDVTITPVGGKGHTLDFYNLEADIAGKGEPRATITLKTQDGKTVALPDPNAISQEYQLTVTDDNTNKSVSGNFTLTIDSPWRYSLCPSSEEIQAGRDPQTGYSTVDKIPTLTPGDTNKINKFHYKSQYPVYPDATYVLESAAYYPETSPPRQIDCNYYYKEAPSVKLSLVAFIDDNIDKSFSFIDQPKYDVCWKTGGLCKFKFKTTSAK
jgi:hypothetical protein